MRRDCTAAARTSTAPIASGSRPGACAPAGTCTTRRPITGPSRQPELVLGAAALAQEGVGRPGRRSRRRFQRVRLDPGGLLELEPPDAPRRRHPREQVRVAEDRRPCAPARGERRVRARDPVARDQPRHQLLVVHASRRQLVLQLLERRVAHEVPGQVAVREHHLGDAPALLRRGRAMAAAAVPRRAARAREHREQHERAPKRRAADPPPTLAAAPAAPATPASPTAGARTRTGSRCRAAAGRRSCGGRRPRRRRPR